MSRIGTVGYLNARPLSDRIDIDQHTLLMAHPAEVSRMLAEGEVDVALVPVAAVLQDAANLRIVPQVCIGADGPVHSVLLVAEEPPETWTRVRLDGVSRTSRVLARLLLTEGPLADRVRDDLEIEEVGPNEGVAGAGGSVAALVIGDAARVLDDRWTVRLDLAEIWREWTGLPFVFAVWAGRPDVPAAVVAHLSEAGRAGVDAVPRTYAGEDLRYLTENLRYSLDDRALMGLRRFGALAHRAGLVGAEDVELYGPGESSIERPPVAALLERALAGDRLDDEAVSDLFEHAGLADLAATAHEIRMQRHPDPTVPFVVSGVGEASRLPGVVDLEVGTDTDLPERLLALRRQQDEQGTVRGVRVVAVEAPGSYGSRPNTAFDHQRAVALARVVLDNVDHCVASVGTEGLGMAQASLRMGCDHLGTLAMTGDVDAWPKQLAEVERHIRDVGFEPRRDELPLVASAS